VSSFLKQSIIIFLQNWEENKFSLTFSRIEEKPSHYGENLSLVAKDTPFIKTKEDRANLQRESIGYRRTEIEFQN
jgi:hypothetical protein